jgi:hypothetical protein
MLLLMSQRKLVGKTFWGGRSRKMFSGDVFLFFFSTTPVVLFDVALALEE